MVGTIKDLILFLLLSSVEILLFGSIGYGVNTTVGPSSYKLRDTIKEHARMHEFGVAHGHNHHNHNEAEHNHWVDINVFIFFDAELTTEFFFIAILSGTLLSFFIFLIFWLTNQNAIFTKQWS